MTKKLLFVTTLLLVVAFVAFAADVTGRWTYETAGRNGGPARQTTITLKQDGARLTGSVPGMMMGGRRGGGGGGDTAAPPPPPADQEISNGKVDGNNVYFEVKRTTANGDIVTKYEGTLDADSLKLKITTPNMQGGDPRVNEVVAKRSTT